MKAILYFLSLALALTMQSPAAHANRPNQSETLQEAGRALLGNKFEEAAQLFSSARQQILLKKTSDLSDEELYQLIQINRSIARAMANGHFGDPCKPLILANDSMIGLSIRAGTERRHPFEQALSLASRQIQEMAMEHDCVQKIANNADPDIAGIYYLRGVMETASGVKLDPDGRYEWFLSVGGLDLVSKGAWQRQGDHIQLISDQPAHLLEVISDKTKLPFQPREEVEEAFIEAPENANYAILFKASGPDNIPPRAFAMFTYADGREELVGSVSNGRLDVQLHADDLPMFVRFLFNISDQMVEVKTDIRPSPGSMHQFTIRRPSMQELGIATMLYRVDGDILRSANIRQKGAYVKVEPKPES